MNEETFNMSVRKFLKTVGVRSQAEIEHAVNKAIAEGMLQGNEAFVARMQLTVDTVALSLPIEGEIRLE